MAKKEATATKDLTVEQKLRALYDLQLVDSRVDKIKTIRGELPLEVLDLEDEIAGLDTRVQKQKQELTNLENEIVGKKAAIKESQALIKKYETQQQNVRNNREFDSLAKEMEFQNLEIQLAEKRIKEFKFKIEGVKAAIDELTAKYDDRANDLKHKKAELDDIVEETKKEEESLQSLSNDFEKNIEERYLAAYKRIRHNSFNGMAVVAVERDSCGGCFNKIPPQRQLDIAQRKKIIVCEHCGRVLVDLVLASEESEKIDKKIK
jgi:uncharacterized protein